MSPSGKRKQHEQQGLLHSLLKSTTGASGKVHVQQSKCFQPVVLDPCNVTEVKGWIPKKRGHHLSIHIHYQRGCSGREALCPLQQFSCRPPTELTASFPLSFQNSYLNRLKGIRATLETSPFFKCHEVTRTLLPHVSLRYT